MTVPSQLRDCPGTLVQELTGVQLKVEWVQLVVHVVANSGVVVVPRKVATVTTTRSPTRVKSFRMRSPFSEAVLRLPVILRRLPFPFDSRAAYYLLPGASTGVRVLYKCTRIARFTGL